MEGFYRNLREVGQIDMEARDWSMRSTNMVMCCTDRHSKSNMNEQIEVNWCEMV
jgi:hypothetical protein